MTVPDIPGLLRQAVAHHQRGELAQADALYAAVLRLDPVNFDALHLSGVVARQARDAQAALDLIGRAIAVDSGKAIAHCNLGAVLQDLGRETDALASYERALALQPDYAMAWCNRGNALRRLDRPADALDSYGRALALTPRYPEALYGAALALQALGQVDDALDAFERTVDLKPGHAEAWCGRGGLLLRLREFAAALDSYGRALAARPGYARAQLGMANTLRALGRKEDAVHAYQLAREFGADGATVDYMLAALGAAPAPQASPPGYVAALFDQYAHKFDRHLVDVLHYRTPALLVDALARHLPAGDAALDVLDLGCGTGLCGPLLRPLARRLEGVDLSAAMLAQAREPGVYDALHCAELTAFLQPARAQWDVLAAADVLVYVGELDGVFGAARDALRDGGLFVFSVEALEEGAAGFALRESGRYAHTPAYVRALAARHGFAVRELAPCTLRQDSGADIGGLLAVLRCPAPTA